MTQERPSHTEEGGRLLPPPSPASLISGVPGTVLAILTGLSGIITSYQNFSANDAKDRVTYDTVKLAIERTAEAQAEQARAHAKLTAWVQDISERLERRQLTTEKAIARKVTKPSAPPPLPPLATEPVPPAPPSPAPPQPAILPAFDALPTE